jgi:hypothetical protein
MKARMLLAAALLATAGAAQAGRPCEATAPSAQSVQRAMELAERTARALDASGAQVVVLARAGQNLGEWGLRWSHLGWAYREQDGEGQGDTARWRVVHKLNQCGSTRGDLYRQGLGEFFMDDLYRFEAAYAVPTPAVQAALLPVLRSNARVGQLHEPAYNMVAYPWAQAYQQSNQWAIETLALAMAPAQEPAASNRQRAQAWLQFQGYEPTTLRISTAQRLGARLTAAHIAFDDHPNAKRFSSRIETVTVDSVFAWLERSRLAGPVQVLQ